MSAIDVPDRIKIGYADFPVRMVDKINDADHSGESCWAEQYIKICDGLSQQHKAHYLVHEIVHMLWAVGDLEAIDTSDPEKFEEKIVSVLAALLTGVFRDNPQLLAYLQRVFHASEISS